MPAILNAPIPGESLTKEPGNAPWEQPPKYNTPQEALAHYFEKFDDEEMMDDLLFMFDQKMPISTFVESLTTVGVMEGLHTIDVSMLIAPVLHEWFVSLCKAAKIKYKEDSGPSEKEKKAIKERQRLSIMISQMLDEDDDEEAPFDLPDEAASIDAVPPSPSPQDTPVSAGGNLIPRRGAMPGGI